MSQPVIVLGDATSHGGTVAEGAPTATSQNKPIARVGDKVTCPKCGSTTVAEGDSSMLVAGNPVARHGDKTACGAKLIAAQMQSVMTNATGRAVTSKSAPNRSRARNSKAAEGSSLASASRTQHNQADQDAGGGRDRENGMDTANDPEPSGRQWVERFPTSDSVSDLEDPFSTKVANFIAALEDGGASVHVSATYRPPERAYLMYWAYRIAHGADPTDIPSMEGVNIGWAHRDDTGQPNLTAAKNAAQQMVTGYNIAYKPASPKNTSRHTLGLAVDMTITGYTGHTFRDSSSNKVDVMSRQNLYDLGASYGVIKLIGDAPHWSDNGH